jgi:Glycosyltransferase family 87
VTSARRRRIWLVALALVGALLLVGVARVVTTRYHDDTLWANALGSAGGTQRPSDFGYVFLPAANDVLAGRDPYMNPDDFTGPPQAPYAYPPVVALVLTPLALLPEHVGGTFVPGVLFTLLLIAATIAGLYLLGVTDWRCYPIALVYPFTLEAVEYGAIGPVLLLLVALVWRYRDTIGVTAPATGGAVVLKLFTWPLLVWLAITGRIRAAVAAAGLALALALVSWAVLGFSGIGSYPRLLDKLVDVEAENSYSLFAILRALGLPEAASRVGVILVGGALLVLAWRAATSRDSTATERDRRSLSLVVAAALVLTPILWLHYLVLLLVPLALARPRLSPLWAVPLVLTVFEALDWYRGWPTGDGKALASVAVVSAIVVIGSLRRGDSAAVGRRAVPAGAIRVDD